MAPEFTTVTYQRRTTRAFRFGIFAYAWVLLSALGAASIWGAAGFLGVLLSLGLLVQAVVGALMSDTITVTKEVPGPPVQPVWSDQDHADFASFAAYKRDQRLG
jgi:hypothetical protein